MSKIRLALLYQKLDNNGILNDPSDTLYYGARITDPDQGIHYTFLKSPSGDIGLLRTENTDQVLEDISNLIEVCIDETKKSSIKLTFLLKWNSNDNLTTWADTITNEFLLEYEKLNSKLKVTIPTYNIDSKKKYLAPFLNDDSIALSFKVTNGRDMIYLKEAIPELFRRIYSEELITIDSVDSLLKNTFLEMDLLKANDSRQDNEVIKSAIINLRSQAIRKNIEDWLAQNSDIFQSIYYKYDLDMTIYSNNQRCYIILESKNPIDEPIIKSEINVGNALMYVSHTTQGLPLETEIVYAKSNQLESAEQISDHTFIAYGSQHAVIYSSTPNLLIRVVRTANLDRFDYMEKHNVIIDEYISNKELVFKQGGRYYTFNITGTPSKDVEIGKLRDFIWRMATKSGWGDGWSITNTNALQQDKDIGDSCNTRTIIPLSIDFEEFKTFNSIIIYIDDYYAVASDGGSGGIQSYDDSTGRLCYQGYAVYANNEASIPNSKLNIPLIMDNHAQAQQAHLKITYNMDDFKWDGSWNLIYTAPTGTHGLSISQTRRKGRLLGGYNFKYYLRIKDDKYLELLCEYYQAADGDSGDNCYTQGAARMGVYIQGQKDNTMKINILDYFSKEIVYSYNATDVKTSTPSLQVIDDLNNYTAYLALSTIENNGFVVYDTDTNQKYYAKEIVMNKERYIQNKIIIPDYPYEAQATIKTNSSSLTISGVINAAYAQTYEYEKSDTAYTDKIYYSASDEKYYTLNNETQLYEEVDYDAYLDENTLNIKLVEKVDGLNLTEMDIKNLTVSSLLGITTQPNIKQMSMNISNIIDNLYDSKQDFEINLINNSYKRININNQFNIDFLFIDNELIISYSNYDDKKILIDCNMTIKEVNE